MRSTLVKRFRPGPLGTILHEGHAPLSFGSGVFFLVLEALKEWDLGGLAEKVLGLAIEGEFAQLCRELARPETTSLLLAYVEDGEGDVQLRHLIPWRDDSPPAWQAGVFKLNLEPYKAALRARGIGPLVWSYDQAPSPLEGAYPDEPAPASEGPDEAQGEAEPSPPQLAADPIRSELLAEG